MSEKLERGDVVLAPDPYRDSSNRRPFVIISDSDYPFYPHGYLSLPVTTKDKSNTFQIHEHDIENVTEELHVMPSYVNPWSPVQMNNPDKKLIELSDDFCDILAERVAKAVGGTKDLIE